MFKLLLSQFIQILKNLIGGFCNVFSSRSQLQNKVTSQTCGGTHSKDEGTSDSNLCSVKTPPGPLENGESLETERSSSNNGTNTVVTRDEDSDSDWTNSDCLCLSKSSAHDSEISENGSEITDRFSFFRMSDPTITTSSMNPLYSRSLNDQTSSSSHSPCNSVEVIEELSRSDSEYESLFPSLETFHENDSYHSDLVEIDGMIYDFPDELQSYYFSVNSEHDPYYDGIAASGGAYFMTTRPEDDPPYDAGTDARHGTYFMTPRPEDDPYYDARMDAIYGTYFMTPRPEDDPLYDAGMDARHGTYFMTPRPEDDLPYDARMTARHVTYFMTPRPENDDPYVEDEDFLYRWLLIQHGLSPRFH